MTEPKQCLNCGAVLTGQYCAECGQQTPRTQLVLSELLHDATHELTSLEGKVPKTLKALFLEPGRLTLDFLGGRRARWLSPLRVYLICSVAYFLSGPMVESFTHRSFRQVAELTGNNPNGSITLTPQLRQQLDESLPARVFGRERMERAVANSSRFSGIISEAYPKAMFLLLPLFALFTSIAWHRKLPEYPAHVYIALHLHAAGFGASAIANVATMFLPVTVVAIVMGVVVFPYFAWYALTAFRRIFGDSWLLTVAKTVVVGAVYSACLFAASLGVLAYAVMTM